MLMNAQRAKVVVTTPDPPAKARGVQSGSRALTARLSPTSPTESVSACPQEARARQS